MHPELDIRKAAADNWLIYNHNRMMICNARSSGDLAILTCKQFSGTSLQECCLNGSTQAMCMLKENTLVYTDCMCAVHSTAIHKSCTQPLSKVRIKCFYWSLSTNVAIYSQRYPHGLWGLRCFSIIYYGRTTLNHEAERFHLWIIYEVGWP